MSEYSATSINGIAVKPVTGIDYVSKSNPLPVSAIGLNTDGSGNLKVDVSSVSSTGSLGVNLEGVGNNVNVPVTGMVELIGGVEVNSGNINVTGGNISVGNQVSVELTAIGANLPALPVSVQEGGLPLNVNISNGELVCAVANKVSVSLDDVSTSQSVSVVSGDVVSSKGGLFISGSSWTPSGGFNVKSGWSLLCTASNNRVRLISVMNTGGNIFGVKLPSDFILYLPVGVSIDLVGKYTGDIYVSLDQGLCGILNDSSTGAYVNYFLY